MKLDCIQEVIAGTVQVGVKKTRFRSMLSFFGVGAKKPRSLPSQANPTIILGITYLLTIYYVVYMCMLHCILYVLYICYTYVI